MHALMQQKTPFRGLNLCLNKFRDNALRKNSIRRQDGSYRKQKRSVEIRLKKFREFAFSNVTRG